MCESEAVAVITAIMPRSAAAWHDRRVRRRMRTITPVLPTETGVRDGLAYSLWVPEPKHAIAGGIVILHGAGSCKENHHDFARAALGAGFASLAFDQRGHGASEGPMDASVLDDVAAMAALLRSSTGGPDLPVALRGSSMGGYLAVLAAPGVSAQAIVAICPASAEGLRRGLAAGTLRFDAEVPALDSFLERHDLYEAVGSLAIPLLLLHAAGGGRGPGGGSRARRAPPA